MTNFSDLPLSLEMQKALQESGFVSPTQIQSEAIPLLLSKDGVDFHGQAQTGTGKTLAFGIPLLEKIVTEKGEVQALVVAPTRELVLQIVESLQQVACYKSISIVSIYGGVSIIQQERNLKKGAHIVVGTTGRVIDHIRRGTLKLGALKTLVLDEADIMLDMGFKEDIDTIISKSHKERSIWLFSATVKSGIKDIITNHMNNVLTARISPQAVTTENTQQYYGIVPSRDRLTAISRIIDCAPSFYGIIFTETKALASDVAQYLARLGYEVDALHGDMTQVLRNRVIKKFKSGTITILVATDVAARGIDIAGLTHVINYSLPRDQESYVHRIGRTGRAGKQGCSISLLNPSELGRLKRLAKRFRADIQPLSIPTFSMVVEARVQKALHCLKQDQKVEGFSQIQEKILSHIKDFSKQQLIDGLLYLLNEKFGNLSQEHTKDFSIKPGVRHQAKRDFSVGDDMSELMLNVGTMDGLDRDSIRSFILSSRAVKSADLAKLRVIKSRTFFVVPKDCAKSVIKELERKKLGGRKTRVSVVS